VNNSARQFLQSGGRSPRQFWTAPFLTITFRGERR